MTAKAIMAWVAVISMVAGCRKIEQPKPWSSKLGKVAGRELRDAIDQGTVGAKPADGATSTPGEPEVGVRITIVGDRPSDEIAGLIKPGSRRGLPGGRVFSLKTEKLADLRQIILKDEVSHVEVERPTLMGPPIDFQPLNLQARISHLVPEFAGTYPGNDGAVTGAVFDEGAVLATHVEFRRNKDLASSTRVTNKTSRPLSRHSTHVAGTIGASGLNNNNATGMAPGVRLSIFDWINHLATLAAEAASLAFSSHSYGPAAGWLSYDGEWWWFGDAETSEDGTFGKYNGEDAELDRILAASPLLLTVAAAGNDRGQGPSQAVSHWEWDPSLGKQKSAAARPRDGQKRGGLDTLSGLCLAKNSLCIGSIHDITQAGNIQMTDYSSWGPADDMRVKPDLVANGQQLLSTSVADDFSYVEDSGTSMATPVVSGISALLMQHFQKARGRSPWAAEIKAILIHTATDAGQLGPDPAFGWGSVNALRAGHAIARRKEHLIDEALVAAGQEWSRQLAGVAGQPARVTVVWTDPPAPPNANGINDNAPTLQNDVDVTLTAPDGKVYFPYSLNAADPLSPATRSGPNRVDNVEVIDAPGLAGQWRLSVRGHVFKSAGPQRCAVVASGFALP